MVTPHQKLPRAGPEREALRRKGQFWTPDWVAQAMVSYAAAGGSDHVFDPAVGAGAFFRAAKVIAGESGRHFALLGTEIDAEALEQARANGLSNADLSRVEITDFTLQPPRGTFKAIVANPPYIRHHRLPARTKGELKRFGARLIGAPLDGRAGLHVYFLLRALQLLEAGGRLAFIVPADICEGIFASALWVWIARRYCLEAVVTFRPEASPFPNVDTNPLVLLIRNSEPAPTFFWAQCAEAGTPQLKEWISSGFQTAGEELIIVRRDLAEGLATGLSRAPLEGQRADNPTLGDFARVMRGIATGANDYFFLTTKEAAYWHLPAEYLLPAVGRTRDVCGDEIRSETIKALEEQGKPTLLFSPDGRPKEQFPTSVQKYLRHGEGLGLPAKTLIATRRPWYKMETRSAPPILFAYLGRRNARFIRNLAGVVPLTGFLCIYPHQQSPGFVDKLWEILSHPETIRSLPLVGKSYGAGAIKVEPRALERLPLARAVTLRSGLRCEPSSRARDSQGQAAQPLLPLGVMAK